MKLQPNFFLSIFVLLLSLMASASNAEKLISMVDRTPLAIDETFELTVRYSGKRNSGQPDFSELENDFTILGSSQSNQYRSINGQITAFTDWKITLAPKKKGDLLIPSFKFSGIISDAVIIKVTEPQQAPEGQLKDVFVETVIEKDSAHVQEQILVLYRLYYSVNVDSLDNEPLELENVLKEDLPVARYTRKIAGQQYHVVEFGHAIFPQTSGELVIPELKWTAKIPTGSRRSFFDSGRIKIRRLRTDAKTLTIHPQAPSFPTDSAWIAAEELKLTESWSKAPSQFKLGEPITRTITLDAKGVSAPQLPQIIDEQPNSSIKIYPDQPQTNNDVQNNGVQSKRVESAAVVVNKPGEHILPPIKIHWWNVKTGRLEIAKIPERKIIVVGDTLVEPENTTAGSPTGQLDNNSAQALSPEDAANLILWKILSVILAIVAIVFAVLWWNLKRQSVSTEDAPRDKSSIAVKPRQNQLKRSCKNNEAQDIRRDLLAWAGVYWEKNPPKTLSQITERVNNEALSKLIYSLDSQLYSDKKDGNIDGHAIFSALETWINSSKKSAKESDEGLPQLYPTS